MSHPVGVSCFKYRRTQRYRSDVSKYMFSDPAKQSITGTSVWSTIKYISLPNLSLQLGVKEASLKEAYLNGELKRCKVALADLVQLLRTRRIQVDKTDKEYVNLLTSAICDAEQLQHSLREQRSK